MPVKPLNRPSADIVAAGDFAITADVFRSGDFGSGEFGSLWLAHIFSGLEGFSELAGESIDFRVQPQL